MMRTIERNLILLLLLLCAPFSLTRPVTLAQEPRAPLSDTSDYFPEKWVEYSSEPGRFRIRFPGKPKDEFSVGVHYISYGGLLQYRVSYVDEPELAGNPDSAKRYLREMKAASDAITTMSNERIVKEREVTVNGYPGYFTHVETAKGWVRDLQLVVGQRVYTIVVEGRKARPNDPEGKDDFEKLAMAFINSFKLIPPSVKPNIGIQRTRNTAATTLSVRARR
jgi:hypothetical protein